MDKKAINQNSLLFPTALYCTVLLALAACTESQKVVLTSPNQAHELIYNCNDIQPQAESAEDIKTVIRYLPNVVRDLVKEQRLVTLQSLDIASKSSDVRTMELIIVKHLCEQKTKK